MPRTLAATLAAALTVTLAPLASATEISSSSTALNASGPIYRAVAGVGADETSVNFSWRSTFSGAEVVRYYPAGHPEQAQTADSRESDYGAIAYLSRFAEVTGLEPGTTYTYEIGSEEGGWSAPESFTLDDGDGAWKFIAVSDAQIGVNLGVAEQASTWRSTAANAAAAAPDASLFLSMGDQVEGWGGT